jgi:hypothetical protein
MSETKVSSENADSVREVVRKGYAGVVAANEGCCGTGSYGEHAEIIGYSTDQHATVGESWSGLR